MGCKHKNWNLRKLLSVMSIRHLSSRIELNFWQMLISLMSESQPFQRSVRWLYLDFGPAAVDFYQKLDQKRLIRWAVAGLGFGLITGFLISLF
jgi:hypothetical protein